MNFVSELRKLNKHQREAVEAIDGPVMVIAGPGTGKTQILTLRIANILQKTDTPAESILALTFTESAVASMKQRLLDIIGIDSYKVSIKTIHGFCNEIIQEYPEKFPMIAGESNITDVEQLKIIRELLETNRRRFARDLISAISGLKREGLLPKDVTENEELAHIYREYQRILEKSGQYDYDDMVVSVARVLSKDKNLRLTLQEKYLYILVDEHQDTNASQNKVIELLAEPCLPAGRDASPNIFVVGDPKQAIYRFQGASLENFSYFKKRFKRARVIALTENYRSTQTILDAAATQLKAKANHKEHPISIVACESSDIEPYVIARHIEESIKKGVKPEEIAVLYRVNKDSAQIARYLEKLGIPVAISAGDEALESPDVKKLILFLEAVRDLGADYAILPVLYLDISKVMPLDIAILIDTARQQRVSVFSLVRDLRTLQKIIPHSAEAVFNIYSKLSLWRAMSKSFSLMPMFEAIIRETGLVSAGMSLFPELKQAISRRRDLTLDDFLEHLDIMREHKISIQSSVVSSQQGAVRLMTAHKSKGLEFEYVYIMGATNAHWEGRRKADEAGERNLFYVALTRAKKEVLISYGKTNADGKPQLPSEFIKAIRPELVKEFSPVIPTKAGIQSLEFKESKKIEFPDKKFLQEKFLKKGLSVSALNNYLECPVKFYFLNLIGMPEAPNPKAQAGNAAHGALKYAVERKATRKEFLDRFVYLLSKEPMREIDYYELIKKGKKVLSAYYDANHKNWNSKMKCEFAVEGVKVGDITVRGRLDRLDLLLAINYKLPAVRVIDYKFKKPAKDPNYYRQLTFYKLLIEEGTGWHMTDAILDFLEPAPNGKFKPMVFAPSNQEVNELKQEIIRVTKEILSMEFLTKGCHEKDCKYCNLKDL